MMEGIVQHTGVEKKRCQILGKPCTTKKFESIFRSVLFQLHLIGELGKKTLNNRKMRESRDRVAP